MSLQNINSLKNNVIIVHNHLTNQQLNSEITTKDTTFHIICTEKFPLTPTKKIEILMTSETNLYEIDLIAKLCK